MAELRCADGTVVEISAETEKELREAFGPKPEKTYKIGDIFWRDEPCDNGHYVRLQRQGGRVSLFNFLGGLLTPCFNNTMRGYCAVQDINAITMAEVRSMTSHPAGLRHVGTNRLVITEK